MSDVTTSLNRHYVVIDGLFVFPFDEKKHKILASFSRKNDAISYARHLFYSRLSDLPVDGRQFIFYSYLKLPVFTFVQHFVCHYNEPTSPSVCLSVVGYDGFSICNFDYVS